MKFLKTFENHNNTSTLIIVDVQKSFRPFFTEMYLHELKKYCNEFSNVYQIWDNHPDGKNVDKDYLYDENPDIPIHKDLYHFPNQKDLIEKRYQYDVDAEFYKKILDKQLFQEINNKEENEQLKRGDIFETKEGTHIVYIGNNHKWYHVGKKMYNLFTDLKGKEITIVGGSSEECLLDVITAATSLGVIVKPNYKFIYSAVHCPIK
jgi:hypothetical protein